MKTQVSTLVLRTGVCMLVIFSLALTGLGRVAALCTDEKIDKNLNNISLVKLCTTRATIFDTNMSFLTNGEIRTAAVIYPTKEAISQIGNHIAENGQEVMERLRKGYAAVAFLKERVWINGVECFEIRCNSEDRIAVHTVGYCNNEGVGVTGLENSFNDKLLGEEVVVKIPVAANGKPILSEKPEIEYNSSLQYSGVITTLDKRMQKIAEEASENISAGAVVITEVGSGKIRAMVSRPNFNPDKIYESLDNQLSPLINRALCTYNVGSVFKPCIAAAALDSGISDKRSYDCSGSSEIGSRIFKCNNLEGHGTLTLEQALGKSCNCYFYSLALTVGAEKIYKTAASFPFLNTINLADGLSSQKGSITPINTLKKSEAAVANFAIGQGDVLLSPLAISSVYEAIANGGIYHTPNLIEGYVENAEIIYNSPTLATRAFSSDSADIIRRCLINTITDGTGMKAKPERTTAAGKTATAETGWLKDGQRVTHGWFCGFFPAENPKYVVVVISEGANSGGSVCAPIFKQIADGCVDAGLVA